MFKLMEAMSSSQHVNRCRDPLLTPGKDRRRPSTLTYNRCTRGLVAHLGHQLARIVQPYHTQLLRENVNSKWGCVAQGQKVPSADLHLVH